MKNMSVAALVRTLLVAMVLFLPMRVEAVQWSAATGPGGGTIRAIAIDPASPATLYAGTSGGGLFKSIDAGVSWGGINNGLSSVEIRSVAIDPSTPSLLYVGSLDKGVFKSSDGGASWSAINNGLGNVTVQSIAVDPLSSANLYAGTATAGLFKSTDAGASWVAINSGLTNTDIRSVAIDPATPATLYVGTFGGGVFKSVDSGASWLPVNAGGLSNASISSVVIDPVTPATLYAGNVGGGVFKSVDGGANWGVVKSNAVVFAVAIDPTTPAIVYAGTFGGGLFKSIDFGATWAAVNTGLINTRVYSIAIDTGTTLYTGTDGNGLFKSTDGGTSWLDINTGLSNTKVQTVVLDPINSAIVYAGTFRGGAFKSIDGGISWTAINLGLGAASVQSIAIDPVTPATIYAGVFAGGIFKSVDSGANWVAINTGLGNALSVYSVVVDPLILTTLYAGTSVGVYKTVDAGLNWTATNLGLFNLDVRSVTLDVNSSATLYVGTFGGGLFRSTDSGVSWVAINNGLSNQNIQSVVINQSAPATLYAGTSGGGMFKSTDSGTSWSAINTGVTNLNIHSVAVNPLSDSTLYAGTANGVFKSTDGGANWVGIYAGLTNAETRQVAIDPLNPSVIYAGSWGGGVQRGVNIAPVGSITIDNGNAFTGSATVSLTLTCDDGNGSGCFQMQFSNDNINWSVLEASAGSKGWTLVQGTDGARTVYARFTDVAGNVSAVASDTIMLDTAAPAAPTITAPANNIFTNNRARPVISGTAEANSSVSVKDGASFMGFVTATGGNWSLASAGTILTEAVYHFTATATDQSGNTGPTSSVVVYTVDTTAAVIVLNGANPVTVEAGQVYVDAKATVTDNVDATNVALTGSGTVNTAVPGSYTITYNYTDAANNAAASVTRTVNVVDTTAAVIVLNGVNPVTVEAGQVYVDAKATVTDNVDATNMALAGTGTVNTAAPGSYTITYNYTDAANNAAASVTRTVNVVDTMPPIVTAPPAITQEATGATTSVVLGNATASDIVDGALTPVADNLGPYAVGVTIVSWAVTDAAGNAATATQRVTITDTTAALLTPPGNILLTGDAVLGGLPDTDAAIVTFLGNVSASDRVDGMIVPTNNAPPLLANGVATVVAFTAVDAAGNVSSVSATVTVNDPAATGNNAPTASGNGLTIAQAIALGLDPNAATADVDGDGVLDAAEVGDPANPYDRDADGVLDLFEAGANNLDASMAAGLPVASGTVDISSQGQSISNVSFAPNGAGRPAGVSFPFGTLSYSSTVAIGGSQTIRLSFSVPLPVNLNLYKVDHAGVYGLIPNGGGVNQWIQVDANTVALTLLDGGVFDLDGVANGVIVDPVSVGSAITSSLSGVIIDGGCVISPHSRSVDPLFPVMVLLSLFYLGLRRHGASFGGER